MTTSSSSPFNDDELRRRRYRKHLTAGKAVWGRRGVVSCKVDNSTERNDGVFIVDWITIRSLLSLVHVTLLLMNTANELAITVNIFRRSRKE
mmetsp:Transcript_12660/g.12456  ORF Transcript_12660/g.12456 Transcript_12660/m.12456 type:complete len:92 (-) Transcript_12660:393-668(-)